MFVQIGRVGRSLGVHLLLASQRLEEGRLRGLDTHLSYRIGLRTFSAMESRAVLGVADAYELPPRARPRLPQGRHRAADPVQGRVRLRAATARRPRRAAADRRPTDRPGAGLTPPTTCAPVAEQQPTPAGGRRRRRRSAATPAGRARRAAWRGSGPPAHQVWLPPLEDPPTLDQLLPAVAGRPERGLDRADPALLGALQGVVGIVDKPFEQRRDPMVVDLSGGGRQPDGGGRPAERQEQLSCAR